MHIYIIVDNIDLTSGEYYDDIEAYYNMEEWPDWLCDIRSFELIMVEWEEGDL